VLSPVLVKIKQVVFTFEGSAKFSRFGPGIPTEPDGCLPVLERHRLVTSACQRTYVCVGIHAKSSCDTFQKCTKSTAFLVQAVVYRETNDSASRDWLYENEGS
jgi:hypothetical protein